MDARELRIGNLIHANHYIDGKFPPKEVVVECDATTIKDCERYGEDFNGEPIELTEDWLKRFGFRWVKSRRYWQLTGFALYQDGVFYCADWSNVKYKALDHIKYVHQLQNVYFILMNKELKIEENERTTT